MAKTDELLECASCNYGILQRPANGHPSYLECPNCGALELTYTPQEYQQELHVMPYTEIWDEEKQAWVIRTQIAGAFGGYGSGKSTASLWEIFLRALENPNGTGLLTATTLQQLKRTTLKTFFHEVCPPPLVKRYNKTDGEIELINGFVFYTIPSDDEEKIRSINAGLIHMEEASGIKRTIYDQLITRMRDPFTHNKLFMVCSNPDLGWIKEVFADNIDRENPDHPEHSKFNKFIRTFIWPTHLNKKLPPDFVELQSIGKPEWWIRRYLMGSFEHSEGMVYPNFVKCFVNSYEWFPTDKDGKALTVIPVDQYGIPKAWERFVSLDHGRRNPTAVYFHAIDPMHGRVITYNEYYVAERLVPDHAKALKPLIEEIAHGTLRFMVADPSIRNRLDPLNGKSVQGLYQEYGLFFSEGNNDVEAGILKVNSYIERGKWVIFKDRCPNLCKEGIGYKFPEQSMDNADKNLDERPVKANDHAMDSCRYGFMRLPDDPDMLKTLTFGVMGNFKGSGDYSEWHMPRPDDDDDDDWLREANTDWTSYT